MTIRDIAKEAGYSVGTVSRVLNHHPAVSEEARERVMEVVEKHHFRLNNNAKHLKQQANSGIAVIVKGTRNMLFATIVETLQELIKQKGYVGLVYYIDEDENEVEQALQVCRERQPMGILFLGCNLEYFSEGFEEVTVPCVLVTNSAVSMDFPNLSSVSTDDTLAACTAVEYLLARGHRRIGILGGNPEISQAARDRYKGCRQAFDRNGITFCEKQQYEAARFAMPDGYRGMSRLLDKMPDITAVFAMADVLAVGAIRAIRDRGLRVPEDVSVVGFDGIELGQFMSPRLTTIKQHGTEIARDSIELLDQCIREGAPTTHRFVDFLLVDGESTCDKKGKRSEDL